MDIGKPGQYSSESDAAVALAQIRSYQPFKYGGKWIVGIDEHGQAFAYRRQRDVSKRMRAAERALDGYRVAVVG